MNLRKFITTIIVLLIDQIIKCIVQTCNTNISIIDNVLEFKYLQNDGAAFSMLSGQTILLIIVTIVISIIIYKLMSTYENNLINDISFGLVFGGIFGNLIDRIVFQYVRDFISVGNFPVFNIADSAIVIGITILMIVTIKGEIDGRKRNNDDSNNRGKSRGKTR